MQRAAKQLIKVSSGISSDFHAVIKVYEHVREEEEPTKKTGDDIINASRCSKRLGRTDLS